MNDLWPLFFPKVVLGVVWVAAMVAFGKSLMRGRPNKLWGLTYGLAWIGFLVHGLLFDRGAGAHVPTVEDWRSVLSSYGEITLMQVCILGLIWGWTSREAARRRHAPLAEGWKLIGWIALGVAGFFIAIGALILHDVMVVFTGPNGIHFAVTIGIMVVGVGLAFGTGAYQALSKGERSNQNPKAPAPSSGRILRAIAPAPSKLWTVARAHSQALEFEKEGDGTSFRDMKNAWRTGAWRRTREWRETFLQFTGALMFFLGFLGLLFFMFDPPGDWLVGAFMCWVVVRLVWAFWRA